MDDEEAKETFWLNDFKGKCMSGIYYRAFDFIQFIKEVEKVKGKVVGIRIDGNNVEIIHKTDE